MFANQNMTETSKEQGPFIQSLSGAARLSEPLFRSCWKPHVSRQKEAADGMFNYDQRGHRCPESGSKQRLVHYWIPKALEACKHFGMSAEQALFSILDPRRSGNANVLGDNDRARLHGHANDPGDTLNPGCSLARNRDGDDGGRYEPEHPALGGSITT
jgi:hypothetical protein